MVDRPPALLHILRKPVSDIKLTMNVRLLSLGISAVLSAPSIAQDAETPLSPLFECRQIADDDARLLCLDAAVDALYRSETAGDIVAVDRSELEAAEEATYGLNIPQFRLPSLPSVSMPRFSASGSSDLADAANTTPASTPDLSSGETTPSAQPETPQRPTRVVQRNEQGEITAIEGLAVQSIDRDAYDRIIITLQNGQVWRQIDDTRVLYSRRQPFTEMIVHVRSAALGSHLMQLNDRGRWFRARREE